MYINFSFKIRKKSNNYQIEIKYSVLLSYFFSSKENPLGFFSFIWFYKI